MRRGPAEHSTGPLTCGFAVVHTLRDGTFQAVAAVPLARLERATFCSGDRRSIHPELQGPGPNHTEGSPGPVDSRTVSSWPRDMLEHMFQGTCGFEGCTNNHRARGLCSSHLDQLARGKELTPLLGVATARSTSAARFPAAPGSITQAASAMATPPSAGAVGRCRPGEQRSLGGPKGYVFIRCPDPDHPNAKSKPGWIAEHVWVMSQLLGRPLRKGESVHHRNNIKHDNRPGNLELWHTHQPKGASVEDTVRWAR
jgi:hypothetical protein